jgi:nitrogen regulatory protein PII
MKAVLITYGQSLGRPIEDLLDQLGIRGFTRWTETFGRGSESGEPHYGTHAWPSKNGTILAVVQDDMVAALMDALRRLNEQAEQQGLSAFVWNIEEQLTVND